VRVKVTINFRKKTGKKGRKKIIKSWEREVPDLKAAEAQAERMLLKIEGAEDFRIHEEE